MRERDRIDNTADTIDSRDIIARVEYLEGLASLGEIDEGEQEELEQLNRLTEEVEDEEWEYGLLLINEHYFTEYAQDFAAEIGAIPNDTTWPLHCIDWEWAARELKLDYYPVTFDGITYYHLAH